MGKSLFIAEKPSVAMEFAKALKENMTGYDGYRESEHIVITWCVGHLVTMSYPEAYDAKYKRWSLDTLPFIPDEFKYEVIPSVKKQFRIVRDLLNRKDVDRIYVCTDSGREGEYIYRLVAAMAGVKGKEQRRVWIDSQTEEEILRGIREAKDLSEYDHLSDSAYLRAKEDYLMGINFSRLLTLKYGNSMASFLNERYSVVSVGRVMTCVLGMVVRREREIRDFVKQPFYRVVMSAVLGKDPKSTELATGNDPVGTPSCLEAEFRAVEGSAWYQSPAMYKENGFKKKEDAEKLIDSLAGPDNGEVAKDPSVTEEVPGEGDAPWRRVLDGELKALVESIERKTEKKNPPLLYNLAELQNECSRMFHISPDQTLSIAQELYEKKLVTYPRTDARVLSSAAAKVIEGNLRGLTKFGPAAPYAADVLEKGTYKIIAKTRYVDDKQITDHYALVPTGAGLGALKGLTTTAYGVYCLIVRRFLGIFYPPAKYQKTSVVLKVDRERFFASTKVLTDEGYLAVMKKERKDRGQNAGTQGLENRDPQLQETEQGKGMGERPEQGQEPEQDKNAALAGLLKNLKKGQMLPVHAFEIKEGETSPPKRYNSGSMILAMENAGSLIEDEELREQIRGAGIGTSATRAEILKKLVANKYIALNKKTQILTPTLMGEMVFDAVRASIPALLNPDLTASWERGLSFVAQGSVTTDAFMKTLKEFIVKKTDNVMGLQNQTMLRAQYEKVAACYPARTVTGAKGGQGSKYSGNKAGTRKNARSGGKAGTRKNS